MQQNLNKLNFDKITKGIGYVTCDSKRTSKARSKTTEDNTEEDFIEETDGHPDIEQEERSRAEAESACWYVPRLGKIPQDQPKGIFRLVGGNLNSASTKEVRDRKIADIHRLFETWDIQGGGFSEIGVDWRRFPQKKRIDSWFRTSQDEYQTSVSHNCQEEITGTTRQQGGIAIFAGKELRKYILRGVAILEDLGDGTCG
jgi:hypothetical protein